jgi:hypothetical protein
MVEALTIVLSVGVTRGWRSALVGVGAALVALSALDAALGPSISSVPIDKLRRGPRARASITPARMRTRNAGATRRISVRIAPRRWVAR